jgi:hypothetical protein
MLYADGESKLAHVGLPNGLKWAQILAHTQVRLEEVSLSRKGWRGCLHRNDLAVSALTIGLR